MSADEVMTAKEREVLLRIAKQQARVAKSTVAQRQAQLLADFETQSAAIYSARDAAWVEVVREAEAAVAKANVVIADACRERGIPQEFAPSMLAGFSGRGQNADKSRRVELRKLAERQIEAAAKSAKLEIDRADAQVQVRLLTTALTTADAQAALASLPTPEELMPSLALLDLEQQLPVRREIGWSS